MDPTNDPSTHPTMNPTGFPSTPPTADPATQLADDPVISSSVSSSDESFSDSIEFVSGSAEAAVHPGDEMWSQEEMHLLTQSDHKQITVELHLGQDVW
eukprot:CAMPEP_0202688130 /NCGR_PEP_ID=MMETSP1385-20130828/3665_1 /ASSEMBLY_ACC=CAM_ASM_000861 /TAXON_ID=933848 /ORGANISM="Elphidium margaritaceum" /LENGTH=97 /DNA_ID=CAMNT_0049343027 /DNA_START=87 /DNA_END=377 /DNA_ORIENTATION=-